MAVNHSHSLDDSDRDSALLAWLMKLRRLSGAERLALAHGTDTPAVALELLCSDECSEVVDAAIANQQLDYITLQRLAGHSDSRVLSGVATHPHSPWSVVFDLASNIEDAVAAVALGRMSRAEATSIRQRAADDERTPRQHLLALCQDAVFDVREAAARTLTSIDAASAADLTRTLLEDHYDVGENEGVVSPAPGEVTSPTAAEVAGPPHEETASPSSDETISSDLPESVPPEQGFAREDPVEQASPVEQEDHGEQDEIDDFALWWDEIDAQPSADLFDILEEEDDAAAASSVGGSEDWLGVGDRATELASQIMAAAGWRDGREVLERLLARARLGQTRVALMRAIKDGMRPEELELVMAVREHWEANFNGAGRYTLSWRNAREFINGFDSYPDPIEATEMLNDIYDRYKRSRDAGRFRDFGAYFWHLLQDDFMGFRGSFQELPFRMQGGRW